MDLVIDRGCIKVYSTTGSYVIFLGDTYYCTCADMREVSDELRSLDGEK